jgi:hypothetical protein
LFKREFGRVVETLTVGFSPYEFSEIEKIYIDRTTQWIAVKRFERPDSDRMPYSFIGSCRDEPEFADEQSMIVAFIEEAANEA